MRMARAALCADTGKLGFGGAGHLAVDEPINRHSSPFLRPGFSERL
jgi:hypothetical protein